MQKVIGVFDSGVGGITTASTIQELLPDTKILYYADSEHCPYGERTQADLIDITSNVVSNLAVQGAELIVIACNTATTQCIHALREKFPSLTFVGTEPAIKVACDASCQNILLMATPSTITSAQVQRLCNRYVTTQNLTLLPCPGLAELVEQAVTTQQDLSTSTPIQAKLTELFSTLPNHDGFDAVVLGCTHYIFLKDLIQKYFPYAKLIDGNLGVAKHVQKLITDN